VGGVVTKEQQLEAKKAAKIAKKQKVSHPNSEAFGVASGSAPMPSSSSSKHRNDHVTQGDSHETTSDGCEHVDTGTNATTTPAPNNANTNTNPEISGQTNNKSKKKKSKDTENLGDLSKHSGPSGGFLSRCCCCSAPWDRYIGKKKCYTCGVPVLMCDKCCTAKPDKTPGRYA
jgi:hypothetical protein